ncbi:MAG: HD domain-containing protein [Clostridium sp.]
MLIKDKIYGRFEIDGILKELILSLPVQRLKGVYQGGSSPLVNPLWNVTRYEHSIGTMLLIKILGGSVKEQIAGLLHDISHTAFSHVVDFALNHKNEDYHEVIYEKLLFNSEIPNILLKYGYDSKEILLDHSKWTILERSAPALCADRVDYTLRDMYAARNISSIEISDFLKNLKVINNEIMITSLSSAKWFVKLYYKEVIEYFNHPLNVYGYNQLSLAIKIALSKNIISLDDLLLTDSEVLKIMKNSNNQEILSLIKDLNQNVNLIECEEDYDFYHKNKLRTIDPSVFIDNKINISSKLSKEIEEINKKAIMKASKGVYIKIITS